MYTGTGIMLYDFKRLALWFSKKKIGMTFIDQKYTILFTRKALAAPETAMYRPSAMAISTRYGKKGKKPRDDLR
jgi:hypothetical protein